MKTIKIWFTDFYKGFEPTNNYFYSLLSKMYNVEIERNNPDYLIYSCYGEDFLNYDCLRIYYTGENLVPDFNLCDYAIGFHYLEFENRYLRFPNFALVRDQFNELLTPINRSISNPESKKYFCNFIYGNAYADPVRDSFFHKLNKYKKVISPGSHLNNSKINIGGRYESDWMYSKLDFQSKCKFSIAFENSSAPGYTTEKIMHAFISNTIPIYWGNPEVIKDFNPKSFINCHEFESFEEAIERVKEVDHNNELYNLMISEPPFSENKIPERFKIIRLTDFFKSIFDQDLSIAGRRPKYGTTLKYENILKSRVNPVSMIKKFKKLF